MLNELYNPFDKIITDKQKVIQLVEKSISQNQSLLLTYLNQNCFNIFQSNKKYREIVIKNSKYYLDGYGVYSALKFFGVRNLEKFNASEINSELFDYCARIGLPVIIIGGKFSSELIENCNLNIELYLNGYEGINDKNLLIKKISRCKAKFIVLGLGVPKQEILAYELLQIIPDLKIICVGNFLEFYFGTVKRAPKFLHNSGFEWIHRLITEPKRLWKRYLIGIPIFMLNIIQLKRKANV